MWPWLSYLGRLLCWLCLVSVARAADTSPARVNDPDQGLVLSAQARTPDQMVAFYTGRGFPAAMLEPVAHACFITVGMRHTRDDIIWLEPSRWRIVAADGGKVQRLDRDFWDKTWETLQAPPASRATFGWTQLPESRDLQPGEPVGGNITIVPPNGAFRLEMRFATGADKKGPELVRRIDGLICHRQAEGKTGEGSP